MILEYGMKVKIKEDKLSHYLHWNRSHHTEEYIRGPLLLTKNNCKIQNHRGTIYTGGFLDPVLDSGIYIDDLVVVRDFTEDPELKEMFI